MRDDVLESAADELAEIRGKLDATRESLRRVLEVEGGDQEAIRQAVARLDRMAAELEGVVTEAVGQSASRTRIYPVRL